MSFYTKKQPNLIQKTNAIQAHAQRRVRERLGNNVDVQRISKQIKDGDCRFLYRESHRISHHLVTVGEKEIEVVYDTNRHLVVTVLFPERNVK